MTEITTEERMSFLRSLPYVDELFGDERVPCAGIRWSEVPVRALYSWGPGRRNPPTGTDRFRCRLRSTWLLAALESRKTGGWERVATSGTYCTHHLLAEITNSEREQERTKRRWVAWRKRREEIRERVLPSAQA